MSKIIMIQTDRQTDKLGQELRASISLGEWHTMAGGREGSRAEIERSQDDLMMAHRPDPQKRKLTQ